jgi:hypothetical protein
MKLFLIFASLNLVLALAVAGLLHVRRASGSITITLETGAIAKWLLALKEAGTELLSNSLRRRRHGSDEVTSTGPCFGSRRN